MEKVSGAIGDKARVLLEALPNSLTGILVTLQNELHSSLRYHNVGHTIDVLDQAMILADFAELPERETDLLVIAAIYHDAGFLHQKALNEPIGAELAAEAAAPSVGAGMASA